MATAKPRSRRSRTVSKYFSIISLRPVNTQTVPLRPDGGALLTLRNGEEIVTRRVVSAAQLADEKRMYWFINAVRRDLALEAGSLPVDVVGTLRRLQERGLPSYMAG